jgi:hypothetical protein
MFPDTFRTIPAIIFGEGSILDTPKVPLLSSVRMHSLHFGGSSGMVGEAIVAIPIRKESGIINTDVDIS